MTKVCCIGKVTVWLSVMGVYIVRREKAVYRQLQMEYTRPTVLGQFLDVDSENVGYTAKIRGKMAVLGLQSHMTSAPMGENGILPTFN